MVSKEQEREALRKIKELVESLGENSYVAMAFEGCFEVANDNIRNDFACSMKQKADIANEQLNEAKKQLEEVNEQLEVANQKVDTLAEEYRHYREKYNELAIKFNNEINKSTLLNEAIEEKNTEITKLKAKLYDSMEGK